MRVIKRVCHKSTSRQPGEPAVEQPMRIPVLRGTIDRRLLVNFRVRPEVLASILPEPFRPHLVEGWGLAGICLIRLRAVRPRGCPAWVGLSSENAAHRIAVEWDSAGATRTGVFIPRRDSSSGFNALVGGRLFPGTHHFARFDVYEHNGRFEVRFAHRDGTRVDVSATLAANLPSSSIFGSVQQASRFFQEGAVGYSPGTKNGDCQGLELCTDDWKIEPLAVARAESSYFGNQRLFPADSIAFDSAFVMRNIEHEWRALECKALASATCHPSTT